MTWPCSLNKHVNQVDVICELLLGICPNLSAIEEENPDLLQTLDTVTTSVWICMSRPFRFLSRKPTYLHDLLHERSLTNLRLNTIIQVEHFPSLAQLALKLPPCISKVIVPSYVAFRRVNCTTTQFLGKFAHKSTYSNAIIPCRTFSSRQAFRRTQKEGTDTETQLYSAYCSSRQTFGILTTGSPG